MKPAWYVPRAAVVRVNVISRLCVAPGAIVKIEGLAEAVIPDRP
jgi:hypothetical protein